MRALASAFLLAVVCAPPLAQTPLTTLRVASGLARPVDLLHAPGDDRRLFVVEQGGAIILLKDGNRMSTPFLSLSPSKVNTVGNERGLLGMAFHPDYASNGVFFINFTGAGGATYVERYTVSSDPDVADAASATEVLRVEQPFSNHNGGGLKFGPDGYLYVSIGDGGSANDPGCNAQDPLSLLGKLLRLDVDNGVPYSIPASNPFVNQPNVRPEIWAYGLRNPWRFSFDRLTGDLYIGDVGQNRREEIDFQPASSTGGENYGWKIMEADLCHSTSACAGIQPCNDSSHILPIHQYPTGANCSITGGFVYRGCAIPDLRGTYFFADFCSARIWSFRYDGNQMTAFQDRTAELTPNGATINSITSFGEDFDGELYICDRGGEIFKIVPAGPPLYTDLGFGKIGGSGLEPRLDVCGRLEVGERAQFRLRDVPATTAAGLLIGAQNNPTQLFDTTLVPVPPIFTFPLSSDADGSLVFTIDGGIGPGSLFFQYVVLDPGATFGFSNSNAIRVDFP